MLPLMEWKEEKNTPNSWKQQERNNNFQGPMFLEAFRFFFSYSHFMDTCILRNKKKKKSFNVLWVIERKQDYLLCVRAIQSLPLEFFFSTIIVGDTERI